MPDVFSALHCTVLHSRSHEGQGIWKRSWVTCCCAGVEEGNHSPVQFTLFKPSFLHTKISAVPTLFTL